MPRNLQPTLTRGVFGVVFSLAAIGGATASALVNGIDVDAAAVQCTAVTRDSATLLDAARSDAG